MSEPNLPPMAKRFDFTPDSDGLAGMEESETGAWVTIGDYIRVRTALEEAEWELIEMGERL